MSAASRLIRGTLEVDGRRARVDRAIAVSADLASVVGSGTVADDGSFAIEVAEPAERVVVMAGVTDPVVAVAHRAVALGPSPATVALALDTGGLPFHELTGAIEVPGPPPPFLALTVDPVHLDGLPAALEPLLRRRAERVVDASFLRLRLDEPRFALTVQQGTYRIDAGYVDRSRPEIVHPGFDNYVTRLARVDGAEMAAPERFGGVEVEVTRPTRVDLVLRALPDEELVAG